MKKFKLVILSCLLYLCSACNAVHIFSLTPTPMPTNTPFSTRTPRPTNTPIPYYWLETGMCLDFRDVLDDPKDIGCVPLTRDKIKIGNAGFITLSSQDVQKPFLMYCALYDEYGHLLDSEIQKPGTNSVSCGVIQY